MSILNPLYDAVAWLIMRIHAVLVAMGLGPSTGVTWVLTIVVLVALMRLVLLPLFVKQMHSQRKMLALAPQMQELRKRYKSDKQKLNEEMMKLYRENGANPLSGCLPLVAQLPVFFALFGVLRAITGKKAIYGLTTTVVDEANKAHIFGVTIANKFLFQNSSGSVKAVIGVTVVLSAVTTFLTVRQSMKRGMMQTPTVDDTNPMANAQKYMVYIAPLFALSGLYWQYGLVVYWLATNVWTLGQQYFLFKKIPPLSAVAADASATARVTGGSAAAVTSSRPKGATGQASTAKRPATATRPAATKPAAKQTVTTTKQQTGAAKQPSGPAKQTAGAAKASGPAKKPSPAKTDATSLGIPPPIANGSGGGLLRRLGRGRAEPEPEPEAPEVTVVRQQRAKQSRSKRTGKR
ncbi:MAG TPA: membrane protein insertase YidC [Streptosporangiaceae bacterium]|nr:membrane protein insertase YidC [Streptosporangiaceae bacterium]